MLPDANKKSFWKEKLLDLTSIINFLDKAIPLPAPVKLDSVLDCSMRPYQVENDEIKEVYGCLISHSHLLSALEAKGFSVLPRPDLWRIYRCVGDQEKEQEDGEDEEGKDD